MKRSLFLKTLLVTCWLPLVVGAAAACIKILAVTGRPTEFIAIGKIVVSEGVSGTERRTLQMVEPNPGFMEIQLGILEGSEVKRRTLERLRGLHPELKEVNVEIRATHARGSSILKVAAVGEEQKYTRIYLDALLDEYMAFRVETKKKMPDNNSGKVGEPDESEVIMERPAFAVAQMPGYRPVILAGILGAAAGAGLMFVAGIIMAFGSGGEES